MAERYRPGIGVWVGLCVARGAFVGVSVGRGERVFLRVGDGVALEARVGVGRLRVGGAPLASWVGVGDEVDTFGPLRLPLLPPPPPQPASPRLKRIATAPTTANLENTPVAIRPHFPRRYGIEKDK